MAISLADPGGPIEAFKETAATLRTVVEAPEGDGRGELVDAIAGEVAAEAKQRQSPLAGFKPRAASEVMDELREANRVVSAKATPEDAAAFRAWLLAAAQEAADAAKEGGFFGIGAEQVSEREQKVLDQLRETLGPQA
jgi:hypothetical protein